MITGPSLEIHNANRHSVHVDRFRDGLRVVGRYQVQHEYAAHHELLAPLSHAYLVPVVAPSPRIGQVVVSLPGLEQLGLVAGKLGWFVWGVTWLSHLYLYCV